jgi:hypothetical protein
VVADKVGAWDADRVEGAVVSLSAEQAEVEVKVAAGRQDRFAE